MHEEVDIVQHAVLIIKLYYEYAWQRVRKKLLELVRICCYILSRMFAKCIQSHQILNT